MKQIVFFFLLGMFVFPACGLSHRDEVVVIGKTRSYHRPECSRVMMAKTAWLSFDGAEAIHYTPCPYCKPHR